MINLKLTKTLLIALLLLTPLTGQGVTVVNNADGSGYAYGILNFKSDGTNITCARSQGVAYDSYSAYSSTWCSASDGAGNFAYCYTSNPDFAGIIQGLSDYGRLLFRWSTSGTCSAMQIVNSTSYLPLD